jgi:APA family basic amino acid/polyamine antiporter
MAKDRVFFDAAGRVDKKYHTPHVSLWLQSLWASVFVITGSFDMLMDLFVFVTWIFYGFAGYGIFVLRRKMPDAERPFKLKAYPWVPIVFIAFALFYFVLTLYSDIGNYLQGKTQIIYSVLGLLLLAAGVPFYLYFRWRNRVADADGTNL